jgi:hypothetical protein
MALATMAFLFVFYKNHAIKRLTKSLLVNEGSMSESRVRSVWTSFWRNKRKY